MNAPTFRLLILGHNESRAFLGSDPIGRFGLEVHHAPMPPLALADDAQLDSLFASAPDYVLIDLVHEHGDLICGELPGANAPLRLPAGLQANRHLRARAVRQLSMRLARCLPPERILIHRLLLIEADGPDGGGARRENHELRRLYDVLAGSLPLARQLQPHDRLRRPGTEGLDTRYGFALRERLGRILRADLAGEPPDTGKRATHRRTLQPAIYSHEVQASPPCFGDALESPVVGVYRIPAADPLTSARMVLSAAATSGNLDAIRALADSFLDGRLGMVDITAARDWQALGAGLGDAELARELAHSLITGDGLPQRCADGLNWLKHAALSGSARAKLELARHYRTGELLPHRADTARALLRQAAEAGQVGAAQILAEFLDDAGEAGAARYWRARTA